MDVQQIIFSGLTDIVTAIVGVLAAMGAAYIKQHFTSKQISTAASIAAEAVNFVAQTTAKLPLQDATKLKNALAKAKELAGKVGIKLTDSQWETLIESAHKRAKDELAGLVSDATPYTADEIAKMIEAQVQKYAPGVADIADVVRQEVGKLVLSVNITPAPIDPAPAEDPTPVTAETT